MTEIEAQKPQIFQDEHEAFAASRSSQFVYALTQDSFFTTLDQHADSLEGDVKPPLVVLGAEGSGKSAFLANWVAKRRAIKHRHEFLFQHYVGCSSRSCELEHTLLRLETALKDFFQLREMEVPDSEERLRWSLNRFLAAAAKKHSPARIVIIIDGVNILKGVGGRDGELYWLPTELPPSVRFIVSTVVADRTQKVAGEVSPHRTYVELVRRQCPSIRMDSLTNENKLRIIKEFSSLHPTELSLTDLQRQQIINLNASSQPLFLRAFLQSLRLGVELRGSVVASLLDIFVKCNSAFELIDQLLYMLSRPFSDTAKDDVFSDMLGKVLIVTYVAKNGISLKELWGVIAMVTKVDEDKLQYRAQLETILKDFTMVVEGLDIILHSFSHELYREVVYSKFICSSESLIRWHIIMAKFFSQLVPCDRKLECLPHHLEIAGQWTKVKNCLTDIEMFSLWWSPKFKKDFLKLWSSLTARKGKGPDLESKSCKPRPTFDIVEEYVKSLDEFKQSHLSSDDEIADIILQVADFLIEFATLGYEVNADVPALVHPPIPSEDLASLGVPHIVADADGQSSCLRIPCMGEKQEEGMKALADQPSKGDENFPECTTYFFHRWMWIQFPYIALGNCGKKYAVGVQVAQNQKAAYESGGNGKRSFMEDGSLGSKAGKGQTFLKKPAVHRSWSAASHKLPEIKFIRQAAKTQRRVPNPDDDLEANVLAAGDAVSKRIALMNDEIQTLRAEFDFMLQQRKSLSKRKGELDISLKELILSEQSGNDYDKALKKAIDNENQAARKLDTTLLLNTNLKQLLIMCERHPAHCPALVVEIERKLEQDKYLLHEIKSRLWEQKFESQTHNSGFRIMKRLVQDGVAMHTALLEYRYAMKRHVQNQAADDAKQLALRAASSSSQRGNANKHTNRNYNRTDTVGHMEMDLGANGWDRNWHIISSRTGITDADIFFQRYNNGDSLKDQIASLSKASENKLAALKVEVSAVEVELEEVRNEASFVGGQSRDPFQKHKDLAKKEQTLRRVKERTEGAEQLQSQVTAGLEHIRDLLGVPEREEHAPVVDLIRDIETVLDTLIEEREKQQQGQASASSAHSETGLRATAMASPETTHNRPQELDYVLTKFELPKARLAATLPSRPSDPLAITEREVDDDDLDDDGMWDRKFAKLQSNKSVRRGQQKKNVKRMEYVA